MYLMYPCFFTAFFVDCQLELAALVGLITLANKYLIHDLEAELKAEIEELKRIPKVTGASADESFELGHRGNFAVVGIHEEGKDRGK